MSESRTTTAAEVIMLIERLSHEEREKVRDYLERKKGDSIYGKVPRIDFSKAKDIGEEVFERHPELFRKLAE